MINKRKQNIADLAQRWVDAEPTMEDLFAEDKAEKAFHEGLTELLNEFEQVNGMYIETCENEGKLQDEVEVLRKALQMMHADHGLIENYREFMGDTDENYWIRRASEVLLATPELLQQRERYLLK